MSTTRCLGHTTNPERVSGPWWRSDEWARRIEAAERRLGTAYREDETLKEGERTGHGRGLQVDFLNRIARAPVCEFFMTQALNMGPSSVPRRL